MNKPLRKGFTLIEFVVVLGILAILAGVVVPQVSTHMASARDSRRMADVRTVRQAIDQYYADKGTYPLANANSSFGGWDVSHDESFIRALRDEGYLDEDVRDPINDETFHYRYYVYAKGAYGCKGSTSYYVLGIRNFESVDFAERNQGFFLCGGRNWGREFAHVTGGGAEFQ